MKTFVTGGTGLLGANRIRELLHCGHQVRALVRPGSNLKVILGLDIDFYKGNLPDEQSLYKGCKGFDCIIHAAEHAPGSFNKLSNFIEINVRGTQNMVRASEHAHVHHMVYVSDCSVFGGGSKEYPGTELSEFTGFQI